MNSIRSALTAALAAPAPASAGEPQRRAGPATFAAVPPISGRDLGLAGLAGLVFTLFAVLEFWNNWGADFSAYYYAGKFFLTGEFHMVYAGPPDVIGPEMPARWREMVTADGYDDQTYPFLYLPWVAWAMAGVAAHVPTMAAMNAMLVINIGLIMLSVVLAWRLFAASTGMSFGLWALLSLCIVILSAVPVSALTLGQVQFLVFALVLAAFERYQAGNVVLAGVLLAAATMLKITPAAFAIIFLWNLDWRALGAFGGALAAMFAGSVLVAGWELHMVYFELMGRLSAQLFMANIGVSLEAFLQQVVALVQGTAPEAYGVEVSMPRPAWLDPVVKGVFVLGLATIWVKTRGLADPARLPVQLFALAILLPLCTPLGWLHYYLLAAYMLPALFARPGRVSYALFFGFLAISSLWIMYWTVSYRGPVMSQVIVFVPYFVLLLTRVIGLGTLAQAEPARG